MRVSDDDFALGVTCFIFAGAIAALAAPANPASAFLITLALLLLAVAAIWAARDADELPDEVWRAAGRSKGVWRNVLLFMAPLGVGGVAAIAYFAAVRPQLDETAASENGDKQGDKSKDPGAPPPPA